MLEQKTNKIVILEALNKLAEEIYGEFGFLTCNVAEQVEILKEYEKLCK